MNLIIIENILYKLQLILKNNYKIALFLFNKILYLKRNIT